MTGEFIAVLMDVVTDRIAGLGSIQEEKPPEGGVEGGVVATCKDSRSK